MSGNAEEAVWRDAAVWERSGFTAFLREHDIQRSDLIASGEPSTNGECAANSGWRFFRVKRSTTASPLSDDAVVARVSESLRREHVEGACVKRVPWVPGFFRLPALAPLARIDLYQQGLIYGIDVSSGYAVTLLNIQPGEHVLDLCCAPGAKLAMIADLLQMRGSITGVDFSRERLAACRQLVHKYQLLGTEDTTGGWRCRLFHADGRCFAVTPLQEWEGDETRAMGLLLDSAEIAARSSKTRARKRQNKSARAREAKLKKQRLEAPNQVSNRTDTTSVVSTVTPSAATDASKSDTALTAMPPVMLYDKVLVDAECTHDGSIKHLQKLTTEPAWHHYVAEHLNVAELTRILSLQRDLLSNGYALLRPGGTLIYSTCSLSRRQNEDVVRAFLVATPNADLIAIDTTGVPCEPGRLPGTVRFTPAHHTSGLFIAKIVKPASATIRT